MVTRPLYQGRSQDFSKGGGGHTGSNNIVMAFSPRNIVGCLLKKRLIKGGSRVPQDTPSLRPCILGSCDKHPAYDYDLKVDVKILSSDVNEDGTGFNERYNFSVNEKGTLGKEEITSAPSRSRSKGQEEEEHWLQYDLPISTSDALPLRCGGLVVARPFICVQKFVNKCGRQTLLMSN